MSTEETDFRPFKSWRYDSKQVSLEQVIAPPYDVISPREQEALYGKSPSNVVHLILGKEPDFYERARERWQEWSKRGILVQDKQSAFYLYEQTFRHPLDSRLLKRLAVVGILKLEESGVVFRHESTFEGPKRDRLSLLEKVKTNLSPVFGLYHDSKKAVSQIAARFQKKPPLFEARDDQEVLHRGWAIEDEKEQAAIQEALRHEKILIADGHHRYETALEYRRRMRETASETPSEAPYDFVMMALVESGDAGLLVLPTHRILRSLRPISKTVFTEQLKKYFDFSPFAFEKLFESLAARPPQEKSLGLFLGDAASFVIRLKDLPSVRSFLPPNKPLIWYEMEVNLLSHFILDVVWGVPEEKRRDSIQYTHFADEAMDAVRSGKAEAAFLLRAPTVDTVRELAYAGERLPQKTTYFYPKLASGFFFYHHD